jgi:diamine N-acetyltransferase
MGEVTIRRLTLKDMPLLSIVSKKTFFDSFTGTCTPLDMNHFLDLYYNENILTKEIEDVEMNYFFVEINGEVCGYFLFKENTIEIIDPSVRAIELKRFYLLKEYHGKGIAQKMMNFFLDYAQQNNYEMAFLGVWEYNCRAQYFYANYGFIPTRLKHSFPIGNTPQTDVYLIKDLKN